MLATNNIKIAWDAPPVSDNVAKVIVYEEVNGSAVKIGESTTGSFTVANISAVAHTYYATAVNATGLESAPSNKVTISAPPAALKNVKITIEIGP